jgi:23S rRNA pseudouridine955/2504/2580 synthase
VETILRAGADDDGRRLDRLLRRALPGLPLSLIHRLLRQGRVSLDGKPAEAASRVRAGSVIRVPGGTGDGGAGEGRDAPGAAPAADTADTASAATAAEAPGAPGGMILREEGGLLFINKPAGMAVHGPDSLETLVAAYLGPRLAPSLSFRPGPLHRLDKPTSGVVTFAAGIEGARRFSALIRERRLIKRYLALAEGRLEAPLVWEDLLYRDTERRKTLAGDGPGGKSARTRVFPLACGGDYSLIVLEIDTGRTHQIRAQAALRGHPLAGDRKYGGGFQAGGFLLHALSLEFPAGEGPPERVEAPIPEAFRQRIIRLFGGGILKSPGL